MDSNIPINNAYGAYVSSLTASARICTAFQDFSEYHWWPVSKFLKQGYSKQKLSRKVFKIHKPIPKVLMKNADFFNTSISLQPSCISTW